MFLIDDLLMMPARGIMAAFREIHNAVKQDAANESETIRTELSELYMRLETKQLTEAEFDQREKQLLDRLDEIEQGAAEAAVGIGGEEELDDEAADDSEDEYFAGDEDLDEEELEGAGQEGDGAEDEDDDQPDDEGNEE